MMNLLTRTTKNFGMQLSHTILMLVIGFSVHSQALADWPFQFGGDGSEDVWDVEVDPTGGVVVLGTYEGTVVFEDQGGGPDQILISKGAKDIYVAKYAASGNLLWVKTAGGLFDVTPYQMTIDEHGTITIVGFYYETLRFGTYSLPNDGHGGPKGFIGRLSSDGQWSQPTTTTSVFGSGFTDGVPHSVAVQSGGEGIYVAAARRFARWTAVTNDSTDAEEIVYDNVNSWYRPNFSLGSFLDVVITGIVSADDGKIYIASTSVNAENECSQGPSAGTATVKDHQYVSLWQETATTSATEPTSYSIECQWMVEVDSTPASWKPSNLFSRDTPELVTDGDKAYFGFRNRVVIVDPVGNVTSDEFLPAGFINTVSGTGLAVDKVGNLVVSGAYGASGPVAVGSGLKTLPDTVSYDNTLFTPFIAKRWQSGIWDWAKAPDSGLTSDVLSTGHTKSRVAMDSNGQVYVAGAFMGYLEFPNIPFEQDSPRLSSLNYPRDLALFFNGSATHTDHLELDSSILNGLGDLMLGFQAKFSPGDIDGNSADVVTVLDAINSAGGHEFMVAFLVKPNRLGVYSGSGYEVIFDLPQLEDGRWHQYSLYRDSGLNFNNYTLWIDGVSSGMETYNCPSDCGSLEVAVGGFKIGQFHDGNTGDFVPGLKFNGALDEVRIWNGASPTDLQPTLNSDGYSGLLAYWNFDNPYDLARLRDSSGNGYDIDYGYNTAASLDERPELYLDADGSNLSTGTHRLDGFMGLLDGFNGEWKTPQKWVVGDAITAPGGVESEPPDITIEGLSSDQNQYYFFWSEKDQALYSIGVPPGAVTLDWKTSTDASDLSRVTTNGVNIFPSQDNTQYHIAGAPALLDNAFDPDGSGSMRFGGVVSPAGASNLVQLDADNKLVFNQNLLDGDVMPEEVVLLFYKTGSVSIEGNNLEHYPHFVTVQTVAWDNEHVHQLSDKNVPALIGTAIKDQQGPEPLWMVSAGENNTCALDDTGVSCWGSDPYGISTVPALSNPIAVSTSVNHTCAIDDTGVKCWGFDNFSQSTPPALSNPVVVDTFFNNSCAIDDTGVKCWGNPGSGQTTVPVLSNPVAVTLGNYHACALDDTGVKCWGDNSYGQSTPPVLSNPVAVTAGALHTCALDDTGVKCWGSNSVGRSTVPDLINPISVNANHASTCAIDNTGVVCWGAAVNELSAPPPLSNPVAVSTGDYHACVLDDTGVVCWGDGSFGQTTVPALAFNNDTANRHDDPSGGNGYVLFEQGPYDGVGADKAYDRTTRKGQIIPVNTRTTDQNDLPEPFVVAWYPGNSVGIWPSVAVSYAPQWPDATPIIIANQLGSGDLLSKLYAGELQRQNVRIYNQPDINAPGYNPNEEHASIINDGNNDPVVYAMRDDLNSKLNASKAYVLVKYQFLGDALDWRFDLLKVCAEEGVGLCATGATGTGVFAPTIGGELDIYAEEAGSQIKLPLPMRNWPSCDNPHDDNDDSYNKFPDGLDPAQAGWEDFQGKLWARAANDAVGDTIVRYYYPLQAEFFYDFDGTEGPDVAPGTCIPWLNRGTETPIDVAYEFTWPTTVPTLSVGESLYTAKRSLPELKGQLAAQIVFDQVTYTDTNDGVDPINSTTRSLVRLYDPISDRKVSLALNDVPNNAPRFTRSGREFFSDLPSTLRSRLSYDELNEQLVFGGSIDEAISGDPHVLPNIMTSSERDKIKNVIESVGPFADAVDALYVATRNPNQIDLDGDNTAEASYLVGIMATQDEDTDGDGIPDRLSDSQADLVDRQSLVRKPMILSAGKAAGEGYVTLAFNNHSDAANSPIALQVIKVDGCTPYQGNIWEVPSDNVFEEALTLRHTGDFGGDPDAFDFEWYYQPDSSGQPGLPDNIDITPTPALPWTTRDPDFQGAGLIDITIEGAGVLTLSDNWFVTRANYSNLPDRTCNGVPVAPATDVSNWAGAPGGDLAQLATGWIKRVIAGLNPFDSRVKNFHENEASTLSSMIAQAGEPYAGPIPFNPDGDVINNIGLIEAYQTVFERGKDLSINTGISDLAVNNQLLNVATRIGDFYTLLGNEAFADAADPTIGFDTGSQLGSLASSIFTFQNQLASPIDEELALLRGRDDSNGSVRAHPVYNRLLWNFTQGEGEVAYVQSYGITDQPDIDGFITEEDAHALYPQGHGDSWGHYLTAVKMRYDLLQETDFNWIPRTESVLVGGNPIEVDYLDERKFAAAAAAKARAGTEIVNLTYRDHYVEDPNGQWQGYRDTDQDRAWGVDGWARRAGQGALLDWVTANAILPPEDLDPIHQSGIDKIDRTTVPELAQIASQFSAIQSQVDRADAGLNPIGLAKGVVPFDIDPNFDDVVTGVQGMTHFEQIAERAKKALENAVSIFDHVNQQSQALRAVQDDVDALAQISVEQDLDFKHRLIEIYGYPYPNDPDTVPGYDGPDLYKYMYVSTNLTDDLTPTEGPDLAAHLPEPDDSFNGLFNAINMGIDAFSHYFKVDLPNLDPGGNVPENDVLQINYPVSTGADWRFVAPTAWGKRRAPGEIQIAISDVLQAQTGLELAIQRHEHLLEEVEDALDVMEAEYFSLTESQSIVEQSRDQTRLLSVGILAARVKEKTYKSLAKKIRQEGDVLALGIPEIAGFSNSIGAPAKASVLKGTNLLVGAAELGSTVAGVVALGLNRTKEAVARQTAIDLIYPAHHVAIIERTKEVEKLWRQEAPLQLEMVTQAEVVEQTLGRYYQLLAKGEQLKEERRLFNLTVAGDTQEHRYRDMTFRIFRNDALQKYRAQFELAARYIYLAATAYDYETNLLGDENGSGREFLADIVRQRTVGQVINGVPIAGTPGLADVLARLTQNFDVYKGQLGFNNPQTETNRFSLRSELFRIRDDSDETWRETLQSARVDNLWDVPEFRRFARPFASEQEGPQPGLVLRFPTTVTFGLNYFGHPLGGGDSAYSATNFATKIRSVGTWFSNYDGGGLSNTPRIYLFPTGMDVLRSPNDNTLKTREWRIVDQKLPVPFPIGASDLTDPNWIPANDSLSDTFADIRRFSTFRAYHDSGTFNEEETISDSRLIGRSVWNTEWMMIVPGGTLLYDGDEGLDQLISGQLVPGGSGERDGNGIDDIKLFFQTYGYSGN